MQTFWIHTPRLSLRPYTVHDVSVAEQFLGDAETMGFYPAPFSLQKITAMIDRSHQSWERNGFGLFAVFERGSDELVGDCGITLQEIDHEWFPEVGYRFKKSVWGNGYAAEAARAVVGFGFRDRGLSQLRSYMPIAHTRSRRVAEKIGMRIEKEFINVNNKDTPTVVYMLGVEEWERA